MSPTRSTASSPVAEAVTWALLLTGMFLKYVTETTELGVQVFGMVHGVVFIAYCLVTVLLFVDQKWSVSRLALGLGAAVPPFATVPFERYAERARAAGRLLAPALRGSARPPRAAHRLAGPPPGPGCARRPVAVAGLTGVALRRPAA